jgi:hypothetical protein
MFPRTLGIVVGAVVPTGDANCLFHQPMFFRQAFPFWGPLDAHTSFWRHVSKVARFGHSRGKIPFARS